MTPIEWLKARIKYLLGQSGCTFDEAFEQALKENDQFASQSTELQNRKHEIEWELELESDEDY